MHIYERGSIHEVSRAKAILEILKKNFPIPNPSTVCKDPFKLLVRTVISQSTAEKNVARAYENLLSKMPITPEHISEADVKEIEEALRVAGLYRNKSMALKKIADEIIERFGGSLDFIYSLPLNEAREKLMSLPGIGPKTADIILLFCADKPVLPVDTHVKRVSKRLGLVVEDKGGYESIRSRLESLYKPEEYFAVHMLLIALGRRFCKALKPLCDLCPVKNLCPSAAAVES